MASQHRQYFDGSKSFTDAHNSIQTEAGNVTWLSEFSPSIERSEEHC